MDIVGGLERGFLGLDSICDTMSYCSQLTKVHCLWQGELTMKLSLFSSKKLFAVLIKGDNNLYTIESKLLPKKRPHFVSPFTQDINFNESTKAIGEVAPGWR